MKENFHQSTTLSKNRLQQLMQRKNNPALRRFIILYLLFLGVSYWVVLSWEGQLWNVLLAQFSFGILCCSIFAAEHETVHGTAFQNKKSNQIAAFLAGLAHIYPSSLFRALHFTHHRHTHVPGLDPEISLGHRVAPSVLSSLPFYLSFLSGFPLLLFKLGMLFFGALGMPEIVRKNVYPFVNPKKRKKIALESIIILFFYLGILFLAIRVNDGFWGILVGQIIGHCLLSTYLVMEHNGLPHEGNILEKTRSIHTNKFVKLLMWNMPYHAEHHAYPAVPFHALPKLHNAIKGELKHKTEEYPSFHWTVLKKFIS